MKYEFREQDVYDFRKHVNIAAKRNGYELVFLYCPYCKGGSHRDKNTFSINTMTGQFECKRSSCSSHGNMITLARDFDFYLPGTENTYEKKEYRKLGKKKTTPTNKAIEYLKSRGISEEISKKYQITTRTDNDNILVFPFYDTENNLQFVKYRKTDFDRTKDKNKEWCEPGCMPILFGMDHCEDFTRLVITEGQIDSLSLAEAGIKNAVSVPTGKNGFTWVPNCFEWFNKFDELVIFGDNEHGEITLTEELKKRFQKKVKVVRAKDYKGCKDANEMLQQFGKQELINAVNNAEMIPIKQIKRLCDVQSVDIYSMPKILTGIKQIDDVIYGMYFGQVILLTGKRGDGKSTFMGQIMNNAVDQGYAVFAYSGELPDYQFKNWIDSQLAGRMHLITHNHGSYDTYSVPQSVIDKINVWYKEKFYIYDNQCVDDDEIESLVNVIEKSIMQYGVKLICIDNLMSALDVDASTDLYRAQSKFVGKLAKIAKVYNVVVILVAHPRKSSFTEADNDDVSGSADITNRVDVVMHYSKSKDEPSDAIRFLKITKNRLTGKLSKDGVRLIYDPMSKRISDTSEDFKREYGWNRDGMGFTLVHEDMDLPFM